MYDNYENLMEMLSRDLNQKYEGELSSSKISDLEKIKESLVRVYELVESEKIALSYMTEDLNSLDTQDLIYDMVNQKNYELESIEEVVNKINDILLI